ncbi:MAG: cytochrome C oxidase subunit III [Epsilonproteobacteria bacterium]|nr:cytochrome C oxidase subunit III [Campylobacterota bacterium]
MKWFNDNVNILALIGAAVIIVMTVFVAGKYIRQMKTDKSTGELTGDEWDGIGEYNNPIPVGWGLIFVGTIVWWIWYALAGYPLWSFSQIGQWNEEQQEYNKMFKAKWANADKETLKNMGEGVFINNCAPCHGVLGDGSNGKAQNFRHRFSEAQVLDIIKRGSAALGDTKLGDNKGQLGYPLGEMPPGMASGDSAKAIAKYIANGMKGDAPAEFATCAGCHGQDGTGNGGSAPNLKAYDLTLVEHVLQHGKRGMIGVMPAFNTGRLSDIKKKAVAIYVDSIGR